MYAIANTFNVPVRYLIDDSIPVDCDMKAFSECEGLLNVTKDELELLSKYRRLPEHDRCTFELLLDDFLLRLPQEPAAAAGSSSATSRWPTGCGGTTATP